MSAQFQRSRVHPGLIPSLGGTKPQVLWIGCSCSSPSDMRALELDPKDFIAHRNIGNIVSNTDLSTQSSLEYALQILKVKHIVVCGHYNCMFVSSEPNDDVPEKWLRHVKELYDTHRSAMDQMESSKVRSRWFAEIHAWTQANELRRKENVVDAIRHGELKIHAFIYDDEKGKCIELTPQEPRSGHARGDV